jgi:hypothetical protein
MVSRGADAGIAWFWRDGYEVLWLATRFDFLFQVKGQGEELRFTQESAVEPERGRPSFVGETYRQGKARLIGAEGAIAA